MDTTAWIKSLDFTREPEIASHVYSTRSQRGHGQWWIRGGINPKVVGCSDLGFLTRCHSVPFHPTTFHYIPLYSLYIFNHLYIYTLYIHIIYALYYIIWLYAYKKRKTSHAPSPPSPSCDVSKRIHQLQPAAWRGPEVLHLQYHHGAMGGASRQWLSYDWARAGDDRGMTGPAIGMCVVREKIWHVYWNAMDLYGFTNERIGWYVFFACFFSLKGFLDYHGCGLTNWRILGQVTGRVKVNLP